MWCGLYLFQSQWYWTSIWYLWLLSHADHWKLPIQPWSPLCPQLEHADDTSKMEAKKDLVIGWEVFLEVTSEFIGKIRSTRKSILYVQMFYCYTSSTSCSWLPINQAVALASRWQISSFFKNGKTPSVWRARQERRCKSVWQVAVNLLLLLLVFWQYHKAIHNMVISVFSLWLPTCCKAWGICLMNLR